MEMKGVPLDARSQDIYHENYRYDNESETDDEMTDNEDSNSSDDEDFKSTIGNISTKTSKQGKVKIRVNEDNNKEEKEESTNVDVMDDFEREMEREMAARMFQVQQEALLGEERSDQPMITSDTEMSSTTSGSQKEAQPKSKADNIETVEPQDKYDDIYFDSDDETDGKESKKEKQKFKTNDELLYDPNMDDEDQQWMDDLRRTYQSPGSSSGMKNKKKDGLKPLPNSDAVLNCPACFVVVCLDCQRHEIYKTQYRAMFVMNCSVVTDEVMKVPVKTKSKKNKNKNKVVTHPADEFHPVRCDQCKTEIAMYDKDEIYHFFNVVASHT
eukprot:TRINITY_DN1389_c0_g1_i6.p1 TRINITY_DN1389_c0_g1~~TRINITY_DN1389_c0_g1_i6.p1  ORF type:complete len:327 (-),score=83.72 TRINITY_DN1389_c0_g1_i6:507-1487(-)